MRKSASHPQRVHRLVQQLLTAIDRVVAAVQHVARARAALRQEAGRLAQFRVIPDADDSQGQ
jgi:hypothetical protein